VGLIGVLNWEGRVNSQGYNGSGGLKEVDKYVDFRPNETR